MAKPTTLKNQPCPMCPKKTLTLMESEQDVPYFGKVFVFSMDCTSCKYHKADIEAAERKDPCKYTFDITGKDDLNVRIVKSAKAIVKIPHIGTIEPGPAAEGYVTNVEGILQRIKEKVEQLRDAEEDKTVKKRAKNIIKKLQKVLWGDEKLKIILEDPTGNSAIISDKAVKAPLKKK